MKDIGEYIESGIIEAYVLGLTSTEEMREVEDHAAIYPDVQKAIEIFSDNIEQQALANAIAPHPTVKPLLMATLDYISRMEKGESPSSPPALSNQSKISDYNEWLSRPDFFLPPDFADIHAKIISHTPAVTTAIVWIKEMAPHEVHHDEFEKFLIVEGSCTITIANEEHRLVVGNFLAIPLHVNHYVKVTSNIPCKVVLQRVAA